MALRLARNVTLVNIVQLQQLPVALVLRVLLQIEGLVLVVQVVVHAMPDNGLRTLRSRKHAKPVVQAVIRIRWLAMALRLVHNVALVNFPPHLLLRANFVVRVNGAAL